MSDTEHIREIASDILLAHATTVFITKCTACGKKHTESLSGLQTRRFICPSCGGKLDDSPLHQLTLSAMRKLRGLAKPPKKRAGISVKSVATAGDYQLVLQFYGDALQDLDELVALEHELTEELGDLADVDGHDVGSGESNIFIITSDPAATFGQIRPVLERRQCLQTVTAAFRPISGESYTVIWPKGSRKGFVIA